MDYILKSLSYKLSFHCSDVKQEKVEIVDDLYERQTKLQYTTAP